jgi:hypothetical protein
MAIQINVELITPGIYLLQIKDLITGQKALKKIVPWK